MTTEQRAFLAVVLMAAVLILYQTFLVPSAPEAPRNPDQPSPARTETERKGPTTPPRPTPPPAQAAGEPAKPRALELITPVVTPLYVSSVSSDGGRLRNMALHYRGAKPMILEIPRAETTLPGVTPGIDGPSAADAVALYGPLGLVVGDSSAPLQPVTFTMPTRPIEVRADGGPRELVLQSESGGLALRYTLTFSADSYVVDARVSIVNRTASPRTLTVELPWVSLQRWPATGFEFQGQYPSEIALTSRQEFRRTEDLAHPGWYYGCLSTIFGPSKQGEVLDVPADPGNWIGIGSNWYLAALIARSAGFHMTARPQDGPLGGTVSVAMSAAPTVAPGATWDAHVTLFIGPKEYERLRALGLEESLYFGGFPLSSECGGLPMRWVGVPILWLMKWVYAHVGNYGIAIILLTVLSKIIFYPLTVKSIRSMKAMQALQPQINALRNKYRKDPQRLQQETMKLYRERKVNPMGGCLPMVAQVPVFYALYLALSVSVELQNAAFICVGRVPSWVPLFGGTDLWICDLANYDPTYVLPILMGVTMFVQQKMTPVAGDPRQAKMMLFMPFIFTFMFLNLPSGLVLYWTVSNVLQILQQWYMDRPKARASREARDASRA